MKSVLDNLRPEPLPKMWQKCERLSWKTDDERFTMFAAFRTVVWNVRANFVGWDQHAAHCSRICAKVTEQWPKGTPHSCLHWTQGTGRKWPHLIFTIIIGDESWVFGHDVETNQQSFQWKTPTSPQLKKTRQIRSNVKPVLIFFTLNASCTRNLFHLDTHWRENYIAKFWGDWGKTSGADFQTSATKTPGSCIMTTLRLTRRSLWNSFWLLRIRQPSPILPTHRTSPLRDFFPIPNMKFKLKGRRFDNIKENQTVSQNKQVNSGEGWV